MYELQKLVGKIRERDDFAFTKAMPMVSNVVKPMLYADNKKCRACFEKWCSELIIKDLAGTHLQPGT